MAIQLDIIVEAPIYLIAQQIGGTVLSVNDKKGVVILQDADIPIEEIPGLNATTVREALIEIKDMIPT